MNHSSRERGAQPAGSRVRRLGSAALLCAASAACGDKPPTQVERPLMCPSASVPLCTANSPAVAAARDGASDAVGRSVPALENATARAALATSLGQLNAALAAGNVTDARAALGRARGAIADARAQLTSFPGDAADLAAIELALDQVAPLLQ